MMEGLSLLLVGGVFCAGFACMLSWCINEFVMLNSLDEEDEEDDYEELEL